MNRSKKLLLGTVACGAFLIGALVLPAVGDPGLPETSGLDLSIPAETPAPMGEQQAVAVTSVVCVPWQGDPLKPHSVISGESARLKGVIRTADLGDHYYLWDYDDGNDSGVIGPINGAVKYDVDIDYTYVEADLTLLTATLCAADNVVMLGATCDDYEIQVRAAPADAEDLLKARVNRAIDDGLWYIYKNQLQDGNVQSFSAEPVTAWASFQSYHPCATGCAVFAFEVNKHFEKGDPNEDPYVEAVEAGLNWITNGYYGNVASPVLSAINIGPQAICANVDGNGNGIGVEVFYPNLPAYQGGMVMGAITESGTPGQSSGRDFDGVGGNDTYGQIVQDMVDAYAWGQNDDNFGVPLRYGGWDYGWNGTTDNSVNQWAAIGLLGAEAFPFSATIDPCLKSQNDVSLGYTYCAIGAHFNYRSDNCANLVKGTAAVTRPSGLVQMILSVPGYAGDVRWMDPVAWYGANWATAMAERTYYGWLSFVKAMRLSGTDILPGGFEWYLGSGGIAETLVAQQQGDGSWDHANHFTHPQQYGEIMVAAWAIKMLTPSAFAVFGACCDKSSFNCTDDVLEVDCQPPLQWTAGVDCADLDPPCEGEGPIPTVSEWGLVAMALLLLVGAKVYFGRRRQVA